MLLILLDLYNLRQMTYNKRDLDI